MFLRGMGFRLGGSGVQTLLGFSLWGFVSRNCKAHWSWSQNPEMDEPFSFCLSPCFLFFGELVEIGGWLDHLDSSVASVCPPVAADPGNPKGLCV